MTLAKGHISGVCQNFKRLFHWPISFKFHMQPSSKWGKKVYIFRPGHMFKMAALPIYGINVKKSSSEPLDRLP